METAQMRLVLKVHCLPLPLAEVCLYPNTRVRPSFLPLTV